MRPRLTLKTGRSLRRSELGGLAATGDAIDPIADHHAIHARHQPQFEAAFEALRPISQALNP